LFSAGGIDPLKDKRLLLETFTIPKCHGLVGLELFDDEAGQGLERGIRFITVNRTD